MTVAGHVRHRVLVDVDVLALKRFAERRRGRRGGQTADGIPLGPVPERGVHRARMGLKIRRAREDQQERQRSSCLLAGVQQCAPHLLIQRVRFVEHQHQRLLLRTCGKRLVQWRRMALVRAPGDSMDGDRFRCEWLPPRWRKQVFDKLRFGADRRGREADDVHFGVRSGFLLKPDQQRRLAVATRSVEHDLSRRRAPILQLAHERPAGDPLGLPSGQVRRQTAGADSKRTQVIVHRHGAGIWHPECSEPPASLRGRGRSRIGAKFLRLQDRDRRTTRMG